MMDFYLFFFSFSLSQMKNRLRSNSHKSLQKSADIPDLMDEDEALKQVNFDRS